MDVFAVNWNVWAVVALGGEIGNYMLIDIDEQYANIWTEIILRI